MGAGFCIIFAGLLWCTYRAGHWAMIHNVVVRDAQKLSSWQQLKLSNSVLAAAERHDIDAKLLLAVIKIESRFRPGLRSSRGALGFMQVKPIAVKQIKPSLPANKKLKEKLRHDFALNIRLGSAYLNYLLERYEGNVVKALGAYNLGPARFEKRYRKRPNKKTKYVKKVLAAYKKM